MSQVTGARLVVDSLKREGVDTVKVWIRFTCFQATRWVR